MYYFQISLDVRRTVGRLHNIIKLLANNSIMISPTSVSHAFDISIQHDCEVGLTFLNSLEFT